MEGEELKCWVRRKSFSVSPAYLAKILHINRPILKNPLVYDDLCPNEELLRDGFGQDLEFSSNGNSVNVSSLPPILRVLTIVKFHNLYALSSTGYMNLKRALFLHNLISDVKIDICAYIFHVLCKTVLWTESRICVLFCCLISRILKLKGILPTVDESPCTKPCPINMRTFNASISHSRKRVKLETSTSHYALGGIWRLPHYKLNCIKFKGSLKRICSYPMTKRGRWCHKRNTMKRGVIAWSKGEKIIEGGDFSKQFKHFYFKHFQQVV